MPYKDQPRDQKNATLTCSRSFYAGLITWNVYDRGTLSCGLNKQADFIYRGYLEQLECNVIMSKVTGQK